MRNKTDKRSLFEKKDDLFFFEEQARQSGYKIIAGVDEAGRGPLAGPVVAAAVIMDPEIIIPEITDSKVLSPLKRETLFAEINEKAVSVSTGSADTSEIEKINILQATLLAMVRAVKGLSKTVDYILIDGIHTIDLKTPQKTIKKGDAKSFSIAAASIVAKVTRDRIMLEYHKKYPNYNFASHKGYGSKAHLEAIAKNGPSPIHRRTFAGVKEHIK